MGALLGVLGALFMGGGVARLSDMLREIEHCLALTCGRYQRRVSAASPYVREHIGMRRIAVNIRDSLGKESGGDPFQLSSTTSLVRK